MKRVLFLFLDGVGIGAADRRINPLAAGTFPTLQYLTGGAPLTIDAGRVSTPSADLIPLDAGMGVAGRPQSATGQAAFLTGKNAPAAIGEHYGPKPDDRIRELVRAGNLFSALQNANLSPYFCNAYPPRFFAAVESGKRLLSVIQYAAHSSGLRLLGHEDLRFGHALAADYTNRSWADQLGYHDIPVYTPEEAGAAFWALAQKYGFVLHDHWLTDVLGHRQDLEAAVADLTVFDRFLGGLLSAVDLEHCLIVIASDHGNLEDCSHSKHTLNPALCILAGDRTGIDLDSLRSLRDVAPMILNYMGVPNV